MVPFKPKGRSSVCSITVQEATAYQENKQPTHNTKAQKTNRVVTRVSQYHTYKGKSDCKWFDQLGNVIFETQRNISSGEKLHYRSDCVSMFTWKKSA